MSLISNTASFSINSEYCLEQFDNEFLLYSVVTTKAVHLNQTASLVYFLCKEGRSAEQIISMLEEAYPGQESPIRDDVISTLQHPYELGVIRLDE